MRKATIVAALLLLTPAVSQAKTLEDLLVEKGVITKGEAAGSSDAGTSKVYWNQGTRVDFPDTGFTTNIATLLQTRYAFTDRDEKAGLKNTSSFDVNRARLIISGTALNKEFSYMLSTDFVSANDSDANFDAAPSVRDAYIDWKPCNDNSGIRLGVAKTAISRQFNTNQQSMQFADRSATSEYFTIGRATGATAFGTLADGMIEASAGIYNNTTGANALDSNDSTHHTGVAAVRLNPTGKMNVQEEGDIDWTEDLATSVGAAYAYSDRVATADVETNLVNIDANLKYMGWGVHAEYFNKNVSDGAGDPSGFYAQAGYYFVPKKVELAARYGYTDCDNGLATGTCSGNDSLSEASATLNYYFWRHSLKAQLGYDFVKTDPTAVGSDVNSNRYIFQLSSYF